MKPISYKLLLILGIVSLASCGGYLIISDVLGFPLDDAWIHQTYARNFANSGEWTFLPGQPSAGSTSPLWGILVSIGYLFGLNPIFWTYLLGWLSLFGTGVVGVKIGHLFFPENRIVSLSLGFLLCLEWHLVWSAGSGMETLLFALLSSIIIIYLLSGFTESRNWMLTGGLIGLSAWLRPDGVTLLGPAIMILFLSTNGGQRRKPIINLIIGFMIIFSAYLEFNNLVTGALWPNTFFAKQAEYSEVKELSIMLRFYYQVLQPLIGVGVALMPGFIFFIWNIIRERRFDLFAPVIWIGGYLFLYAWRLPVTYQHGRYVMPVIPLFIIFGFIGTIQFICVINEKGIGFVLSRAWLGIICITSILFWFIGANAYNQDVSLIESEMVAIAHWLHQNTPQDAVIGAHDIGAIGFFSDRDIIDLAGLISPDVINFIGDEKALSDFLNSKGADYLVTFPGWYPLLVERGVLIYKTEGTFSLDLGGENMAVYQWPTHE